MGIVSIGSWLAQDFGLNKNLSESRVIELICEQGLSFEMKHIALGTLVAQGYMLANYLDATASFYCAGLGISACWSLDKIYSFLSDEQIDELLLALAKPTDCVEPEGSSLMRIMTVLTLRGYLPHRIYSLWLLLFRRDYPNPRNVIREVSR